MAAIYSSVKVVRASVSSALGIVSTSADSSLILFFSELGSCPAFHSRSLASALGCSGQHVNGTASAPSLHQQWRGKITNKTTTKSQRHTLHIPVKREAEIRKFWTEVRGCHDLACIHRLANFAFIYPRYRDLNWLASFMPQWDSAIERLIAHDMGMLPANELARKHPFILNARIQPMQWAKMAVRGRLPAYAWGVVLADIKKNTGAGDTLYRNKKKGNIAIDFPNKAWRPPNNPKELASTDSEEALDEEDEAWLETVNMHAAAAGQQ